jgi:hypothetical protein
MITGLLAAQPLNFDNLSAHSGQNLSATRTGLVSAKVDYADIF